MRERGKRFLPRAKGIHFEEETGKVGVGGTTLKFTGRAHSNLPEMVAQEEEREKGGRVRVNPAEPSGAESFTRAWGTSKGPTMSLTISTEVDPTEC